MRSQSSLPCLSAGAMCDFDPKSSPYGWLIVKRLQ